MEKNIEDFTKEELFAFYSEIRGRERFIYAGYHRIEPNESLLDDIDTLINNMENKKV